MVKRLADVTHFKRDSTGRIVEENTTVENVAYPPANSVEEYRAAIRQALNILGPIDGHKSGCEGCDVEKRMSIRLLLDALNYETWEDHAGGDDD